MGGNIRARSPESDLVVIGAIRPSGLFSIHVCIL